MRRGFGLSADACSRDEVLLVRLSPWRAGLLVLLGDAQSGGRRYSSEEQVAQIKDFLHGQFPFVFVLYPCGETNITLLTWGSPLPRMKEKTCIKGKILRVGSVSEGHI